MQMPLASLKVIELAHVAAGPFAGSLLADLGADVVKVERPEGDMLRDWPPLAANEQGEDFSECFASVNRNKRSITIDLKDEEQVAMLRRLCAAADVVIENFRPGVLERFGLHAQALREANPRLVYCSVSGYGQTGPNARKGAFDVTIQAFSGLMSVTGEPGGAPVKCGVPVADFCAGLYAAYTILAALRRRDATGQGAVIDCSMLGALVGISALQTSQFFGTGHSPGKLGSAHPRNAPYRAFEASDGYLVVAAGTTELFHLVCDAVGAPELAHDERFATIQLRATNQEVLLQLLQPRFLLRTIAEWLDRLEERGVPCALINDFEDMLADPHVQHLGWVREMKLPNGVVTRTTAFPVGLSDYLFEVFRPPPALGQHNEAVAREWLGC
jgi:crotonobetainyl-CoA:carnitine CoA-transferase CaiB-like acyl-CoA transferase